MPSHKPRGIFQRTKMEPTVEEKPPKMNVNIPELDIMSTYKKHSHMLVSPTSPHKAQPMKSSSGRWNCLCSPTTHAGSFRCRRHRSTGMFRGGSVGSNLAQLGNKAGSISDSLHAQ